MLIARFTAGENPRYGVLDEESDESSSCSRTTPIYGDLSTTGERVKARRTRPPALARHPALEGHRRSAATTPRTRRSWATRCPDEPLVFLKPNTSVIGPDDPIVLPPYSREVSTTRPSSPSSSPGCASTCRWTRPTTSSSATPSPTTSPPATSSARTCSGRAPRPSTRSCPLGPYLAVGRGRLRPRRARPGRRRAAPGRAHRRQLVRSVPELDRLRLVDLHAPARRRHPHRHARRGRDRSTPASASRSRSRASARCRTRWCAAPDARQPLPDGRRACSGTRRRAAPDARNRTEHALGRVVQPSFTRSTPAFVQTVRTRRPGVIARRYVRRMSGPHTSGESSQAGARCARRHPARGGSQGVPLKNLADVGGVSARRPRGRCSALAAPGVTPGSSSRPTTTGAFAAEARRARRGRGPAPRRAVRLDRLLGVGRPARARRARRRPARHGPAAVHLTVRRPGRPRRRRRAGPGRRGRRGRLGCADPRLPVGRRGRRRPAGRARRRAPAASPGPSAALP